jgi:putative transposase
MYLWRQLTPDERTALLKRRKLRDHPWHSPPHYQGAEEGAWHIHAACFEHRRIIGTTIDRMEQFEETLLQDLRQFCSQLYAWSVLPNHYHFLAHIPNMPKLLWALRCMHGSLSRRWNQEDNHLGRQVWCKAADRAIRSERHFWATMNYIHHNPVKHGYAKRWKDWPFSSAERFLSQFTREEVARVWMEYPARDYGKGWDDY